MGYNWVNWGVVEEAPAPEPTPAPEPAPASEKEFSLTGNKYWLQKL